MTNKRSTSGKDPAKPGSKNASGAKPRGKTKGPARRPKQRSLWKRLLVLGLVLGTIVAILGGAAVATIFWHFSQDLPPIFSAADYKPKQVTRIYDRDGNILAELYDERRTVIPIDQIPQVMRYAIIAAEDAQFYEHKGLDYIGVLRAAYTNIRRGRFSQGASTLTQQVVKNLLLTPERELKRKVQEVLLARRLEEVLSKDEILWVYLNHVYFGHRTYGIEEAARFYFDKHAADLNLNQAATLAGLVQSPERLSPVKHLERCRERRDYVLRQMWEKGYINEDAYRATSAEGITVKRGIPATLDMAPHFVEAVRRDLMDQFGKAYVYTAGLEVHTTVDLKLQVEAEHALRQGLRDYDARHGYYQVLNPKNAKPSRDQKTVSAGSYYTAEVVRVDGETVVVKVGQEEGKLNLTPRSRAVPDGKPVGEVFAPGDLVWVEPTGTPGARTFRMRAGPDGALICLDPDTREVLAMVGGYDYEMSSFNRATQAKRQTGSSFKPIVFGAAIEAKVITPATVIDDAPKVFHIPGKDEPWSPRNFDNKFKGPMRVRSALAQSRNTVAVDVLERVGIERTLDFARRIGVTSPLVENFTMALGSTELTALESANAFATFASGGFVGEPITTARIERRNGEVLFVAENAPRRVLDEETAFVITSLLRSVATEGTAAKYLSKWEHYAVGKTGTTNGPRDAWFIGYSDYLVAAVYVGFDTPAPMGRKEGGSKTALPIWAQFMKAAHRTLEVRPVEPPPGVIEAAIDPLSGNLARPGSKNAYTEYFLPGTLPTEEALAPDEVSDRDWAMREIGRRPTAEALLEGPPPAPDAVSPSPTPDRTPPAVDADHF